MNIEKLIDEMIDDAVKSFEDDGMTVPMPDHVRARLKEEMLDRLCDAYNEIRDDIEMDVRAFAVMQDEHDIPTVGL